MKKIVAIILTLTLVAAVIVTPALAVESSVYAYVTCVNPHCDNDRADVWRTGSEEVYNNITVSSCDYASYSHTHVYYRILYVYRCDRCGTYEVWGTSTARIFCGASNMNMRTINQIN